MIAHLLNRKLAENRQLRDRIVLLDSEIYMKWYGTVKSSVFIAIKLLDKQLASRE